MYVVYINFYLDGYIFQIEMTGCIKKQYFMACIFRYRKKRYLTREKNYANICTIN